MRTNLLDSHAYWEKENLYPSSQAAWLFVFEGLSCPDIWFSCSDFTKTVPNGCWARRRLAARSRTLSCTLHAPYARCTAWPQTSHNLGVCPRLSLGPCCPCMVRSTSPDLGSHSNHHVFLTFNHPGLSQNTQRHKCMFERFWRKTRSSRTKTI